MSDRGHVGVDRLWKRFRADRRRMLLRDEIQRAVARIRGRNAGWRWALKDVSFQASAGESVGLVGVNGSGKTTLLKILSRVMYPYAGRVDVGGRVGALIEVRAGIHPDLTGRENIYVTGSLLGLGRRQVSARFDEIVDFAEMEEAVDRQVKFFSSGMQMRLGFAVAAFLEPDVLLVDEALAVGDAAFQQKCLERMRRVLAGGTTLVFVSHDLGAVEATCSRGIWLRDGVVESDGPVRDVLASYRRYIEASAESAPRFDDPVQIVKAEITGEDGGGARTDGPLNVRLVFEAEQTWDGIVYLGVSEGPATPIFLAQRPIRVIPSQTEASCSIPRLPLPRGGYFVWACIVGSAGDTLVSWQPVTRFDVYGPALDQGPRGVVRLAPVHVDADWEFGQW